MGDSVFFDALYTYATDPQFMYGNASTEDVQQVFETVSGLNLSDFFQQWIYDERYPRYYYWWTYAEQESDRYQIQVTVEQRQKDLGWRPVFVMPIDLVFTLPSGDTTFVVQNNDTLQTYLFEFSEIPTALNLDPDRWILRYAVEVGVSEQPVVSIPSVLPRVECMPNPTAGRVYIEYSIPVAGECQVALYDVSGQLLMEIARNRHAAGVYGGVVDARNLAAGVYYLRLVTGGGVAIEKIVLIE